MKTNYYKLNGLKTTQIYYLVVLYVRSPNGFYWVKHKGSARLALLLEGRKCFPVFPALKAVHIPWLVAPSQQQQHSNLYVGYHVTSHITSLIPTYLLPPSLLRTFVIHQAHLDNPGHSPILKTLNLITPTKSLWPCKVILWFHTLGCGLLWEAIILPTTTLL